MARVLVSPLNWGLGHATRDIPVIRTLRDHGHEVTIAACGNALSVLRQEFPDAPYIDYPDYSVAFSFGRFFVPRFCASLPFMLKAVAREHATLESILSKDRYDLVISDNRLGVYSSQGPINFYLPPTPLPPATSGTGLLSLLAIPANMFLHERYNRIIVTLQSPRGGFPCRKTFVAAD